MTACFPGVVADDWRTRLVLDHPALFSDARVVPGPDGPMLSCMGWPNVPDGWRRILAVACARLDAAVGGRPGADVIVQGIKEKYGGLRIDVSTFGLDAEASEAVGLAVDLAEARSEYVCDMCGEPGRLRVDRGWYSTRCDEHADGATVVRRADHGIQIVTRYADGQMSRAARRYLPDRDAFVDVPLPKDEITDDPDHA